MARGGVALVAFAAAAALGCTAGRRAARGEAKEGPSASPSAGGPEAVEAAEGDLSWQIAHGSMCPAALPGTSVELQSTPAGAAMVFTTRGKGVGELRGRVRSMAQLHNDMMAAHGGTGGSGVGPQGNPHHRRAFPPPSRATAEDVAQGGRLELRPANPADMNALRAYAAGKVERMRATGACADLSGAPKHSL